MNGLGTLTGAPQAGMPQVQNPTPGMGGIAQPPAPGGATNRPVVEMRAQILRNIFGNIGAPMPDDVAHQIASQPSPFERQLEGMRQKAVVQGQIDMAKKLMELEVAIEQERRTKQVGREDLEAKLRPQSITEQQTLPPSIEQFDTSLTLAPRTQGAPETFTTTRTGPSLMERETRAGTLPEDVELKKAQAELARAGAEKARRPETSTTDPLISAKRRLEAEGLEIMGRLEDLQKQRSDIARSLMPGPNQKTAMDAINEQIQGLQTRYMAIARELYASHGVTVAEAEPNGGAQLRIATNAEVMAVIKTLAKTGLKKGTPEYRQAVVDKLRSKGLYRE